jgi:hypothetical protein
MSQEIERLTNIEQKNFFMRRHQLIQCIRLNAMHLQLTPVPQTLQPDKPEDQDAKPDRTDRNQIHIHPSLALSDLPTTAEDSRLTIYLKRLVHQAPEHASRNDQVCYVVRDQVVRLRRLCSEKHARQVNPWA